MHAILRSLPTLWLAVVLAWLPASAARADADTREISAYRLTDAGLHKYTRAVGNLSSLQAQAPGACGADDEDDGDDVTGIDEAVAKLESTPGASQAIRAAGMPAREFVVFSLAVLQAGLAAWALDQPGGKLPPDVSLANVDFYRRNQAAMASLHDAARPSGCEDEDADEGEADAGSEE